MIKKIEMISARFLDTMIIFLMFSLVMLVTFQVLNRFILHIPAAWTEEMARYNFVWVSLYGSVKALKMKNHLSVDIVVEAMKSKRAKRIVDLIATSLILIFTVVLIVTGSQYMIGSFGVNCEFGAFPISVIYSSLPIAGVLMFIVSAMQIVHDIKALRGE